MKQSKTPPAAAQQEPPAPPSESDDLLTPADLRRKLTGPETLEREEKLRSYIREEIKELSMSHLERIAQFIDIEEHDHGCDTPAEEFITALVSHHYIRGITPEDACWQLQSFTENYRALMRDVDRLQRMTAGRSKHSTPPAPPAPAEAHDFEEAICTALVLRDTWKEVIMAAIQCADQSRGFVTPAEELISDLLFTYSRNNGLTPESIREDLEKFERDFRTGIQICRSFKERYAHCI